MQLMQGKKKVSQLLGMEQLIKEEIGFILCYAALITLLGALHHLYSAAAGRPTLTVFSSLHTDPHLGDAVLPFLGLGTGHTAITFLLRLVRVSSYDSPGGRE